MKKITAVALASLVAISSLANASRARVNGFGGVGTFIGDVQDVFTIPTALLSFKDAAYVEAGIGDSAGALSGVNNDIEANPWAGVHASMFGGVVGLWANRPVTDFDTVLKASNFTSSLVSGFGVGFGTVENILGYGSPIGTKNQEVMRSVAPGSRIDLFYGTNLNERIELVVGLNRAVFDYSFNDPGASLPDASTMRYFNNSLGVMLGLGIKDLGLVKKLDIGFGYQDQNAKWETGFGSSFASTKTNLSGYNIRLAGNLSADSSKISAFDATLLSSRMNSTDRVELFFLGPVSPEETVSNLDYSLGYALGRASATSMGLGGVILYGNNQTIDLSPDAINVNKVENSSIKLDLVTGGETKLKNWLLARAGVSGKIYGSTNKKNDVYLTQMDNTFKEYPSDATVSTGLTFLIGDISLDTVFNRDFLYTGPYFLSSAGDSLINTEVSATWNFGGSKE